MARFLTPYGLADTRLVAKIGGHQKLPARLGSGQPSPQFVSKVGEMNKHIEKHRRVIRRNARCSVTYRP